MATWAKAFTPHIRAAGNYTGTGPAKAFKPKSPFHNPDYVTGRAQGLTGAGPIPGTFDPALEAQRRAAERGEEDKLDQIRTEEHFGATSLKNALQDITTSTKRKRQDYGISYGRNRGDLQTSRDRGEERLDNQEADTRRNAQRQGEDLQVKLVKIGKSFAELGHRQGEAANAAGVNDGGTAAASAAARARNQIEAEEPIHTAQGRLAEDLATSLSRIGSSRQQLGEDFGTKLGRLEQDYGISLSQLIQDRNRNRERAKQETGQKDFLLNREREQTEREGAIAPVDLLEQEIWEGRQNHPGAYAARNNKGNKKKGR